MSASPPTPLSAFETLGDWLESAWCARDYDERAFPDLALAALERHPPEVTAEAFLRWGITAPRLPTQQDLKSDFGEPPVTVFHGSRFFIEVLFWLDGTTSVHEHAFSGAFHVLAGSSLHTVQQFDVTRELTSQFQVGELRFLGAELLRQGASRRIEPGKLIHSLFHLERPSVSVVVRTHQEPRALPQRRFHRPALAMDTDFVEPRLTRRLQMLAVLAQTQRAAYLGVCAELLRTLDSLGTFLVLRQANHWVGQTRAFSLLLAEARARHGDLADRFAEVLLEERRQLTLVKQRQKVTGADERYFLALLLNLPTRAEILRLVGEHWPQDPPSARALALLESIATSEQDPMHLMPTALTFGTHGREFVAARLAGADVDSALAGLTGASETERERLRHWNAELARHHAYAVLFA